jgi:probable HAF family extracellular repeat protein
MIDLGSLGGTLAGPVTPASKPTSESGGFNNRGQLVGIATLPGDQIVHPFLWDGEKLIDLFTETEGGHPVSAAALNDVGEVVGGAVFPNRTVDAYLWKNGVATDLGTVDRDGCSWARAINSRGQVVGQSFDCDGSTLHAFLWENGSIVDLNKLIQHNSQLQLVDPLSINDRGEIAGIGLPPGCTLLGDAVCGHAFVLIPCNKEEMDVDDCKSENDNANALSGRAVTTTASVPTAASFARSDAMTATKAQDLAWPKVCDASSHRAFMVAPSAVQEVKHRGRPQRLPRNPTSTRFAST